MKRPRLIPARRSGAPQSRTLDVSGIAVLPYGDHPVPPSVVAPIPVACFRRKKGVGDGRGGRGSRAHTNARGAVLVIKLTRMGLINLCEGIKRVL